MKASINAPTLAWDANDTNLIKVSGGSANMYGQPGRTIITFSAHGETHDFDWTPGTDGTLNVKDILPTGTDYEWKAKVVGTDPALNSETDGRRLLDKDRYTPPTPVPDPDPDADAEEDTQSSREAAPVAASVALSTIDGESKPWIRGLAYYAGR